MSSLLAPPPPSRKRRETAQRYQSAAQLLLFLCWLFQPAVTNTYSYYGNTGDQRLEGITNSASSTVLSQFGYSYNAVGDITNWNQTQGGSSVGNVTYGYDSADRVTSASLSAALTGVPTNTLYTYDLDDNRSSEVRDSLVIQGSFNSLNQLTGLSGGGSVPITGTVSKAANVAINGKASVLNTNVWPPVFSYNLPVTVGTNHFTITALDGSGNWSTNSYQYIITGGTGESYTYDANGNTLSDGIRTYQWDAENRLAQVIEGTTTNAFAYDGLGRRISETDNGTLTKQWVWDGTRLAEERNGSNTVTKRFYQGLGEQISGASYYYTTDHLGSVRQVVDGSGTVQASYTYDSYGRPTLVSGSNLADFQYAGMQVNTATGLNLTLYRAYDPNTGRWLSRDPLQDAERLQGPNLYGYVENNPINYIDLKGEDAAGAIIGASIGAYYGGLGAFLGGGHAKDLAVGTIIGAAFGGGVGYADPSHGWKSSALIGAGSAGLGDLIGQAAAMNSNPCQEFNKGEFIGAMVGGAAGGVAGQLFRSLGEAYNAREYANVFGEIVGGQISLLGGFLGAAAGNSQQTGYFMGINSGK